MTEVILSGIVNVLAFAGLSVLIGMMVGRQWAQIMAILSDGDVVSEVRPVVMPLERSVERPMRYAA
ncbi:hypothetical protein [Glacieibacterium sp.]|uniref:hypothetical protein n=1 Tax=Glacieibacterium sp. TaxID=2860237 RepID=UPI003AFFF263